VEVCHIGVSIYSGFHADHDLALGYLEESPVGIDPVPVITSEDQAPTPFHAIPELEKHLLKNPRVTHVG